MAAVAKAGQVKAAADELVTKLGITMPAAATAGDAAAATAPEVKK
jgi:hypothetical protein